jgi:hypothetical protein
MLQLPKSTNEVKTMEGSFVKKQRPFIFLLFLLLATTGCHHKPVKAIVLIPSADNESPSVYAEAGGVLEFKIDEGTPENSTFEVQFSRQVCGSNDKLEGTTTQPVICHLTAESKGYDVTITILETIGGTKTNPGRRIPPREVKAYIRPCQNCKH